MKEEIIRPDCADKHLADMSEDEKKSFKEWEKKVAFRKEEDEKYRKSLESEMKKLITSVSDIYVKFDTDLKELEKTKLKADSLIYRNEIAILKLVKCSIDKLNVLTDESLQSKTINAIKSRKAIFATEIQEVKKILEKLKDECDTVQRKEKESDKLLKKEFDLHHPHYTILKPYFKYRSSVSYFIDFTYFSRKHSPCLIKTHLLISIISFQKDLDGWKPKMKVLWKKISLLISNKDSTIFVKKKWYIGSKQPNNYLE